jgi:AcrR family transcriptional regulator
MSELSDKKMRRCCDEEALSARQEEILETATQLFAEHGFSECITQVLADRLQIGKGTLYRHFPSKRALFLAATDRVMVKLNERVEASIAGVEDGLERVSRAIATYLRFFAENPQFVELLIQERANFKDRKRPTYFEHRERTVVRWRQLYRELIAEGRVRPMPVEQITEVISGAIYGTMFINYFTGQAKPSEVQAAEIVDVAFRGILTESERRRREDRAGLGADVPRYEAAGAPLSTVESSVREGK